MSGILIAYDNTSSLHDFFEACADEARQECCNRDIGYKLVSPPDLLAKNVIGAMPNHQLCLIAAHGDSDGIYNEHDQEVISIHTTNYNFQGKGLYSIACSCAKNLHPHLQTCGLQFFVGYSESFTVKGKLEPFVISAMSGLKSVLSGDNIEVVKTKMLRSFDDQIKELGQEDPIAAAYLLQNKESLVFEGDKTLVLSDVLN